MVNHVYEWFVDQYQICVWHTSIREIVKEETVLRKEKEAVCCYVHVYVHVYT